MIWEDYQWLRGRNFPRCLFTSFHHIRSLCTVLYVFECNPQKSNLVKTCKTLHKMTGKLKSFLNLLWWYALFKNRAPNGPNHAPSCSAACHAQALLEHLRQFTDGLLNALNCFSSGAMITCRSAPRFTMVQHGSLVSCPSQVLKLGQLDVYASPP